MDTDKEFLQLNESLRRRQAENARKRDGLTAGMQIAAALPEKTAIRPPAARVLVLDIPKRPCQNCQKPFEPLMGARLCPDCAAVVIGRKRLDDMRENRKEKAAELNYRLKETIPALFINERAHIRKLSKPLQDAIFALPPDRGLYLWGLPGVGKSFAMAAIARRFICQNKRVRRIRWDDLLLEIRATYKGDSIGSEMSIIDRMTEAACLFIEDLGTTKASGNETDFSLRVLLAIIDGRLENCRPTFITSNLSPEQIEGKFDARIGSRLAAACEAIRLSGRDKRRQQ